MFYIVLLFVFFFKQKTAYEMRISDWSSDVCSSDLPKHLRGGIDTINEAVYRRVNNGVYKAGFATTQEAYEEAYDALFAALDDLEQRLARQRHLLGDRMTEADWRLFTTLVRFDPVYPGPITCNRPRLCPPPTPSNTPRH